MQRPVAAPRTAKRVAHPIRLGRDETQHFRDNLSHSVAFLPPLPQATTLHSKRRAMTWPAAQWFHSKRRPTSRTHADRAPFAERSQSTAQAITLH
ncbi:MAG: hypothetical protein MH252_07650 [Thermosynechococcaceae cyanobacterium MS004]|nr:hypothetical protein [Thermosynechococcaceae cyanobacterium MS004]